MRDVLVELVATVESTGCGADSALGENVTEDTEE